MPAGGPLRGRILAIVGPFLVATLLLAPPVGSLASDRVSAVMTPSSVHLLRSAHGLETTALAQQPAVPTSPLSDLPTVAQFTTGRLSVNSSAVPQWWNVTGTCTGAQLPAFWFSAATWDAADHVVLVYGGDNNSVFFSQTWAFSGHCWTQLLPAGSPGPLSGPSMAYDPTLGKVVMFGGLAGYVYGPSATFLYSNSIWTTLNTTAHPSPRQEASMAFDPALGGVVLFGGKVVASGYPVVNDLWLFNGTGWAPLPDLNPPAARQMADLVWDPSLQSLVLFGGADTNYAPMGDTWTYGNGTWTNVTYAPYVTGDHTVAGAMMDFDPDLGAVLRTGGVPATGGIPTETGILNGVNWSSAPLSTIGAPSTHALGIGVWDADDHEFVVAAGIADASGTTFSSSTQVLVVANGSAPDHAYTGSVVSAQAMGLGANGAFPVSWNWGDGTNSSGTVRASHTYLTPGTYTLNLTVSGPAGAAAYWLTDIDVRASIVPTLVLSHPAVDVGVSETFVANGSGGWPPYAVGISYGDGASGTGGTEQHVYPAAGVEQVVVSLTDSLGGTGQSTVTLQVNDSPTVTIQSATESDAGFPVSFDAVLANGSPPFNFSWTTDGGGAAYSQNSTFEFASPGSYIVFLSVTDGCGEWANSSQSVVIHALPHAVIRGPASVDVGTTNEWTASVLNGTPPFTISWSASDGEHGSGASVNFSFAAAGTYKVVLTFSDAVGGGSAQSWNVTVSTPSNSFWTGSIGGIPYWGLLVVLVVASLVAVVVIWRIRGNQKPSDRRRSSG